MKGCLLKVLVVVISIFVTLTGWTLDSSQAPQNILLIGWDGAQRDHVNECLARNELPALAGIIKSGTMVQIECEGVTATKPGWAQILTGYSSAIMGVTSNSVFKPIPQGYSVFERLEQHFGPDQIVTLAVIGKKDHLGSAPPGEATVNPKQDGKQRPAKDRIDSATISDERKKKIEERKQENEMKKDSTTDKEPTEKKDMKSDKKGDKQGVRKPKVVKHNGEPFYLTKSGMDLFENGLVKNDVVGNRALTLLDANKDKRFFLFVHFAEPDHSGHKSGENSDEYNKALISDDEWTGKILAKLTELGLNEKTAVYVTADHGFDEAEKTHKDAPYVFLGTNDQAIQRSGFRTDITPTVLSRMGIDVSTIQPPLTGSPLNQPAP